MSERKEDRSSNDEYEQQLIDEMGNICSGLAHDLRSPLQTIQNAVFLLERNPGNPLFSEMIKMSLRQATDILDNFRDYYKGHQLKPVEACIAKSFELASSELKIPDNVKMVVDIEKLPSFLMDPAKVAQVFKKLMQNSLEAMPDGGELCVRIKDAGEVVEVNISDTGCGISEDVEEFLYVPFMSKLKKGKGLGLPAVKRIVEAHGGTMNYVSEQGKGTTFTFILPKRN